MRRLTLAALVAVAVSAVAVSPAAAATFTVNLTGDQADADTSVAECDVDAGTVGDQCTLRAAIEQSNTSTTVNDNIHFGIGTGPQTITAATALPTITDTVTIEGNTQPGFAPGNTPIVTLRGQGTGGIDGVVVGAGADSTAINRLVFNNFKNAIRVDAPAQVNGNYIGVGQDGSGGPANRNDVGIRSTVVFGGVGDVSGAATDRNVISNNITAGIDIAAGGGTFQIFNNYIGTNPAGTGALGNGVGVRVAAGADGDILTGNVISGNDSEGVLWNGNNGFVSGSRIGTNAAGTSFLSNGLSGVHVTSGDPNISVGVISGNNDGGIRVSGTGAPIIFGNKIGVGSDGVTAIPNVTRGGIDISSSGATIGGATAGQGNLIANNGPWGIRIRSGTGNLIRGDNSIFGNTGLGIDLDPVGFNPNDADPGGPGTPNLGQNYPVFTSAVAGGSASGTLTSKANTAYRVEVFRSSACDPSLYGEGQTFIGSTTVTSNASGVAPFSLALPGSVAVGDVLTATATDTAAGNTSEFSLCRTVTAAGGAGGGGAGTGAGAGAGGTPGGTATGNGEPDSNIGKIAKSARKLKRFSGTASDPEGRLAAVEIAVVSTTGGARATAKRVKRCLNLQSNGRLKRKKAGRGGRCGPARFLRARGTTKWSYKLKRRLKRGRYVIYARAVDRAGGKETKFSRADRNRVAFKLR